MNFKVFALMSALMLPAPLIAQNAATKPEINVRGTGTVETQPDLAVLSMTIRGEGATADDATKTLADRQKTVRAGLASLDPALDYQTSGVRMSEVRTGQCGNDDETDEVMLDDAIAAAGKMVDDAIAAADRAMNQGTATDRKTGKCRVVGYVVTVSALVKTMKVADAGTMVGLAGRLGASSARIEDFALHDPQAALRRAALAAMADARAKAMLIAEASGAKLGPVKSISTDFPEARFALRAYSASPNEVALAKPIPIDVRPAPVRSETILIVTFALLP